MKKALENNETRKLAEILNLREIRSGRISNTLHPSILSYLKTGKKNSIDEDAFLEVKKTLNSFSVVLSRFSSKEVENTDKYIKKLMDIIDTPFFNWTAFYKKVETVEKPNAAYLQYSYYNTDTRRGANEPTATILEKYPHFFEQLRFEFKNLATKIKL